MVSFDLYFFFKRDFRSGIWFFGRGLVMFYELWGFLFFFEYCIFFNDDKVVVL